MIHARAHDQTVADDYFAAMQRIEQRLEIIQEPRHEANDEVVKVQERTRMLGWINELTQPELAFHKRLELALQLRDLFVAQHEYSFGEAASTVCA